MAGAALLCPQCGRPKPVGALGGLCPACVAQWACQPEEEADETAGMFGPADLSSVEAEPGRATRFGEYQLLEEIGRGGMGIVYRARQLRLNRLVAEKKIPFGS